MIDLRWVAVLHFLFYGIGAATQWVSSWLADTAMISPNCLDPAQCEILTAIRWWRLSSTIPVLVQQKDWSLNGCCRELPIAQGTIRAWLWGSSVWVYMAQSPRGFGAQPHHCKSKVLICRWAWTRPTLVLWQQPEHSHQRIVAAGVKDYSARHDVLPQFSC